MPLLSPADTGADLLVLQPALAATDIRVDLLPSSPEPLELCAIRELTPHKRASILCAIHVATFNASSRVTVRDEHSADVGVLLLGAGLDEEIKRAVAAATGRTWAAVLLRDALRCPERGIVMDACSVALPAMFGAGEDVGGAFYDIRSDVDWLRRLLQV